LNSAISYYSLPSPQAIHSRSGIISAFACADVGGLHSSRGADATPRSSSHRLRLSLQPPRLLVHAVRPVLVAEVCFAATALASTLKLHSRSLCTQRRSAEIVLIVGALTNAKPCRLAVSGAWSPCGPRSCQTAKSRSGVLRLSAVCGRVFAIGTAGLEPATPEPQSLGVGRVNPSLKVRTSRAASPLVARSRGLRHGARRGAGCWLGSSLAMGHERIRQRGDIGRVPRHSARSSMSVHRRASTSRSPPHRSPEERKMPHIRVSHQKALQHVTRHPPAPIGRVRLRRPR
jgi:hypothetical protein